MIFLCSLTLAVSIVSDAAVEAFVERPALLVEFPAWLVSREDHFFGIFALLTLTIERGHQVSEFLDMVDKSIDFRNSF